MNPTWSKWLLYCWLACGVFGFVLEMIGVYNDKDNLPPLTTVVVTSIKAHWWIGIAVFGLPVWLIIHFARRL